MPFAHVAIDVPLPTLFDYRYAGVGKLAPGALVSVPFGRKEAVGVVLETSSRSAVDVTRIRPITRVLEDVPPLPPDVLALLRFCSAYYHYPIGEVVHSALPRGLRVLRKRKRVINPITPAASPAGATAYDLVLTPEQELAVGAISGALDQFRPWLLHGVTGSGKTEVYLRVMAFVLAAGRQVLFLVPEIGLTPQLEARIRNRFPGCGLVTLNSALGATERAQNWLAAQTGVAQIVLGTRSAVFVPLPQLALIVIDEEHDPSFKQIEAMRYSARDLAIWRARQRGVPVILGSATPSLETFQSALQQRYQRLRLTQRANAYPHPHVELVPTASVRLREGLAPRVVDAIQGRLANNEQVLVYINRRGYAPVLLCTACGWAANCSRCSARLVVHKTRRQLLCHHCGHEEPVARVCADCGNVDLTAVGHGTQRIESALRVEFPTARLLRIDRDTTRSAKDWPEMRRAIENREVDILIGTQLLSKGHDFPGLGLVCVLNADRSLYSTDFRAAEHLFAQLTQVAGRAGRGQSPGQVLIQTVFPAHPLYQAVKALNFDAFARILLEERRQAQFPPFTYQAVLRAEATRLVHALNFLHDAIRLARGYADEVSLFDPAPALMTRLKGRERAQLLVQSASRPALQRFLRRWTDELHRAKLTRARWAIDVDPLDI